MIAGPQLMMSYFAKLFPSDIGIPTNLDYLLRIWLVQLLENAVD